MAYRFIEFGDDGDSFEITKSPENLFNITLRKGHRVDEHITITDVTEEEIAQWHLLLKKMVSHNVIP